jgi:UDP-glucuronate 4-epimerase
MKRILVTGAAGFIGSHLVDSLLTDGWHVTAIDNFDPFYPREIKEKNIKMHVSHVNYALKEIDILDLPELRKRLDGDFSVIVHLAAKAGVRPSIQNPIGYQDTNVKGTQHLLELAREWKVEQFVFASSSSVYGVNSNTPWREDDHVLLPISPYASTKVSGELLGHVYSHLYNIRFLALRFFTVYGPRQRPDLAICKFAKMILNGEAIPFFGDGSSRRDYTHVSDIVNAIRSAILYDKTNYEVINLGNSSTITLQEMVQTLEKCLQTKAKLDYLPIQDGDVPQTWASIEKAKRILNYDPKIEFSRGIKSFVASDFA